MFSTQIVKNYKTSHCKQNNVKISNSILGFQIIHSSMFPNDDDFFSVLFPEKHSPMFRQNVTVKNYPQFLPR